ncbi:glycosyltransferase family 2 protein [Thozetella sp. PMI_491]|nr:glycosyltransferase family 2 protein [Thozetella sp. PMI_491]
MWIERLQDEHDASSWKGWRRRAYTSLPFLTLLNLSLSLFYLALRIVCNIWAQQAHGTLYLQAWVFIAVELCITVPSLIDNILSLCAIRRKIRPKMRLRGDQVPGVDVFVTCCGEPDSLVMDTIRAACDVDYPSDKFRVLVLDDGQSPGLKEMTRELSMTYPQLYYVARPKFPGVPHHFKAGNLNYGLDFVHTLPGKANEFMAALDADMIPERDWLRALLPHILMDSSMGLVCPPQLFYNTPPSDPLAQSLDLFFGAVEPIKDALGVAWCTGSGYIARRETLDAIGNFPLGSLAEDVATSTLMLASGWKTAYVHEPLQFGTVPDDYSSHLKQRTRWAIGTVDTAMKLNFCLWGDKIQYLSFPQRFLGFTYAFLNLLSIPLTLSLFTIPLTYALDGSLIAYANDDQLRWLIWACFASTMSQRLFEVVSYLPCGHNTGRRLGRSQLWMAPYISLCMVRSFFLPKWLGGQAQAFKPTGSLRSSLNERDSKDRRNLAWRLWVILLDNLAIFHLVFVYFTIIAVVLSAYRCTIQQTSVEDAGICLLTYTFWPPLTILFVCSSMWTPVSYAIDPPTVPDREDLLERDKETIVAHPTAISKQTAFSSRQACLELEYGLTTLYTALVFVVSFIYWH